jgi:hypothetical protein
MLKKYLLLFFLLFNLVAFTQCNTNNTICTSGTAGPFTFGNGGPAVSTCLDWLGSSRFSYIVLYITQSGPLNLYIDGNGATGYLDVAIFNIPTGVAPCTAIQNTSNQIGCSYAQNSSGCNQFGNAFPCSSNSPAPNVVAGQVVMIVVEDWMNGASTNFTLQLGPPPGAQTGPPNTTITSVGPFCTTSPTTQLQAVNMGGVWSGPGVSSSGVFNPSIAGVGTHTITYTLGQAPCQSVSTTSITVNSTVSPTFTQITPKCQGTSFTLPTTSNNGITGNWSPSINTNSTTTYTFTPNPGQCASTTTMTVVINTPTIPTFTQLGPYCQNTSVGTLPTTSNNGITGTWNPSTINNTTTATYNFTPTAGQCAQSTTMTITINTAVTANVTGTNPICDNACNGTATATPLTGTSPFIYIWTPSGNTQTITGLCDGTYNVTIIDAFGCQTTGSVNLTDPAVPVLTPIGHD